MEYKRLPSDSEKLLYKIVDAFNPTQMVSNLFKDAIPEAKSGLRRLVVELEQYGYIEVVWADDAPCMVTPSNLAKKYKELLSADKEQIASTVTQRKEEPKPISVAQEEETKKAISVAKGENAKPIIFISHRSTDKEVADMLADFFYGTGITTDTVFCSSLPGNDVKHRISDEVKAALKASVVNIAILSHDYYQSAYCLQEAGVIWYRDDIPVVLVALPDIDENKIYGFFDKSDVLRRLNSNEDIGEIYDSVSKAVSAPERRTSAIISRSKKLTERYADFLKTRETPKTEPAVVTTDDTTSKAVSAPYRRISATALKSAKHKKRYAALPQTRETPKTEPAVVTTDDTTSKVVSAVSEKHDTAHEVVSDVWKNLDAAYEAVYAVLENYDTETKLNILRTGIVPKRIVDDERIVLYYMLKKYVHRVSKNEIYEWLHKNEIHVVNVDNAFDRLSSRDGIIVTGNILEMETKPFQEFILNESSILPILEERVNRHQKLASDTFKHLWANGDICSGELGLFIAYIIDEKVCSFIRSFPAEGQIKRIKRWENENGLRPMLSQNYRKCIDYFIGKDLVYKSSSIDSGYCLYPSLEELLIINSEPYQGYLNLCKQRYRKRSL